MSRSAAILESMDRRRQESRYGASGAPTRPESRERGLYERPSYNFRERRTYGHIGGEGSEYGGGSSRPTTPGGGYHLGESGGGSVLARYGLGGGLGGGGGYDRQMSAESDWGSGGGGGGGGGESDVSTFLARFRERLSRERERGNTGGGNSTSNGSSVLDTYGDLLYPNRSYSRSQSNERTLDEPRASSRYLTYTSGGQAGYSSAGQPGYSSGGYGEGYRSILDRDRHPSRDIDVMSDIGRRTYRDNDRYAESDARSEVDSLSNELEENRMRDVEVTSYNNNGDVIDNSDMTSYNNNDNSDMTSYNNSDITDSTDMTSYNNNDVTITNGNTDEYNETEMKQDREEDRQIDTGINGYTRPDRQTDYQTYRSNNTYTVIPGSTYTRTASYSSRDYRLPSRDTDRQISRDMDRQISRDMDRQTSRDMDRQTSRDINRNENYSGAYLQTVPTETTPTQNDQKHSSSSTPSLVGSPDENLAGRVVSEIIRESWDKAGVGVKAPPDVKQNLKRNLELIVEQLNERVRQLSDEISGRSSVKPDLLKTRAEEKSGEQQQQDIDQQLCLHSVQLRELRQQLRQLDEQLTNQLIKENKNKFSFCESLMYIDMRGVGRDTGRQREEEINRLTDRLTHVQQQIHTLTKQPAEELTVDGGVSQTISGLCPVEMKQLKKRAESLPLELCQLRADCNRLQTDLLTDLQQVKDLLLANPDLLAAALKAARQSQQPGAGRAATGQQKGKASPTQAKPTASGNSSGSSSSSYKTASTGGICPARKPPVEPKSPAVRQGSNPTTPSKPRPPVPTKPTSTKRDRLDSSSSTSDTSRQTSVTERGEGGAGEEQGGKIEMNHLLSEITKLKEGAEQLPPPDDGIYTHIPPTPTLQAEFLLESPANGKYVSGENSTQGSPSRDVGKDGDSDASSLCSSNDMRINIEGARRANMADLSAGDASIAVLCRVRPLVKAVDAGDMKKASIELEPYGSGAGCSIRVTNKGRLKSFDVSRVLEQVTTQSQVFEELKPMVDCCIEGSNVTLFGYGHTAAGKSHTLVGTDEDQGLVYRAAEYLLENRTQACETGSECSNYTLHLSVIEMYNDLFRDILKDKRLDSKQNADSSIGLPGLSTVQIDSIDKLSEILKQASANRIKGMNSYNTNSYTSSSKLTAADHCSRSHLIISFILQRETLNSEPDSDRPVTTSKLNLADLAGSEKVDKTGVEPARYKEAQNINKTLTCVGDVMYALKVKAGHVPIRSSKLTHLLQDSLLGSQNKILLLVLLSSASRHVTETISSLMFAHRIHSADVTSCAPRTPSRAQGEFSGDLSVLSVRRLSIGSETGQTGPIRRASAQPSANESSVSGVMGGAKRERHPSGGSVDDGLESKVRPARPSTSHQVLREGLSSFNPNYALERATHSAGQVRRK